MFKTISSLPKPAAVAIVGLLLTVAAADVRVWTGEETVILQGDLEGVQILPSGTAASERSGTQPPQVSAPVTRNSQPAPSSATSLPATTRFAGQTTIDKPVVPPAANELLPPPPARPPAGTGRIVKVGPNEPLKAPSEAARLVSDGDIVEIAAGDYYDCAVWDASNLLIRGVGGRPHFREKACNGKAVWITKPGSRNIVIENIEFSNIKVSDRNGAAVRHEGSGLTLRNVYVHDSQSGLLTGNRKYEDDILIEDSLFERVGNGGQAHSIYVGTARSFTLRNSIVRGCMDESNCVKSRAYYNQLSCNIIDSGSGPNSWEVDMSLGGITRLENNIIVQGPASENTNLLGYAMEYRSPDPRRGQQLALVDNLFINDKGRGQFLNFRQLSNFSTKFQGNQFVGKGKLLSGATANGGKQYRARIDAGLPPAGSTLSLPAACGG